MESREEAEELEKEGGEGSQWSWNQRRRTSRWLMWAMGGR